MEVRAKYNYGNIVANIRMISISGVKPLMFLLTILEGKNIIKKEYPTIKLAVGASLSYGCVLDKWVVETN